MTKATITRLFLGSVIAVVAGILLAIVALLAAFASGAFVMDGPDVVGVEATPAAWTALGIAHFEAGDWQSAIDAWNESIERRQTATSTIDSYLRSMAYWKLGDKQQARNLYDQATKWNVEQRPGDSSLARFRAEAAELLGITEPRPAAEPASAQPTALQP